MLASLKHKKLTRLMIIFSIVAFSFNLSLIISQEYNPEMKITSAHDYENKRYKDLASEETNTSSHSEQKASESDVEEENYSDEEHISKHYKISDLKSANDFHYINDLAHPGFAMVNIPPPEQS